MLPVCGCRERGEEEEGWLKVVEKGGGEPARRPQVAIKLTRVSDHCEL